MRVLVLYGSTEGQTRKICRFCMDRLIAAGHTVEERPADGMPELPDFDAALVAGSVHLGKLQSDLSRTVALGAERLNAVPSLLLVVSLAIAGDAPEDRAALDRITETFCRDTRFDPGAIHHVAGAFRFTRYGFFRSLAMRWIAMRKGQEVDPRADREYTDWADVARILDGWSDRLAQNLQVGVR